uniref:Uncharacterized protein n=1 Tax=Candidozyma auris TaxID=498019 RepID=A0A0L0NPF3_CANAR
MRLGVDVGENRYSRFLEIAIKAMELAPELTFWQLKVFLFPSINHVCTQENVNQLDYKENTLSRYIFVESNHSFSR